MQYRAKWIAIKEIKYDYTLSKKFIEIDEPIDFISTVTNESYRIMTSIRMVEVMPKGAKLFNKKIYSDEVSHGLVHDRYYSKISLTARSKLKRKLELTFHHRGRHVFRGAEVRNNEFLGFGEKNEHHHQLREVVVLPKAIESPQFQEIMGGFLGDLSVQRFIVEDPILTIGIREYTGREPLKQMAWTHTARKGRMMVKQFDYTTEMIVTVFLDVSAVRGKTLSKSQFENCYSLARGVCQYLLRYKIHFEFVSNAVEYGGNEQGMERLGSSHLSLILEKLGRAGYGTSRSYESIIESLTVEQEKDRALVVITPRRDYDKQKLAEDLKEKTGGLLFFIHAEDFGDESHGKFGETFNWEGSA